MVCRIPTTMAPFTMNPFILSFPLLLPFKTRNILLFALFEWSNASFPVQVITQVLVQVCTGTGTCTSRYLPVLYIVLCTRYRYRFSEPCTGTYQPGTISVYQAGTVPLSLVRTRTRYSKWTYCTVGTIKYPRRYKIFLNTLRKYAHLFCFLWWLLIRFSRKIQVA